MRGYFTREHPTIVPTDSPLLLAFVWGVIATWWMGAILGLLLTTAARWGRYEKLAASQLTPSVLRLMALAGICALVAGILGYWASSVGEFHRFGFSPEWATPEQTPRYWAVAAAHTASYAVGGLGGLWLVINTWFKRRRLGVHRESA